MTTNENPASIGMLDGAFSEIARGDDGIDSTTTITKQSDAAEHVASVTSAAKIARNHGAIIEVLR
jgi:hypothetical protein